MTIQLHYLQNVNFKFFFFFVFYENFNMKKKFQNTFQNKNFPPPLQKLIN